MSNNTIAKYMNTCQYRLGSSRKGKSISYSHKKLRITSSRVRRADELLRFEEQQHATFLQDHVQKHIKIAEFRPASSVFRGSTPHHAAAGTSGTVVLLVLARKNIIRPRVFQANKCLCSVPDRGKLARAKRKAGIVMRSQLIFFSGV